MTSYIFLDTLRFFAHHGVGEQETVVGNEFTVSLRLQVDIRRAAETDDVADTVSYADVHTAVKAEMDIPSKLLEHVCGRIINRLFHDFPQIEEPRRLCAVGRRIVAVSRRTPLCALRS